MELPNAAPEEGPVKVCDYFSHWSIGGGEKHHAYVAGPTRWIIGHPSDKGSKPCLTWMTKGKLPCRFCHMHKEPCHLGYLPIYRAVDWRPKIVIVRKDEREWTDKLATHMRILIGREREEGAPLYVRPCLDQSPAFASTIDYRQHAQDCQDSMLTFWKMPELVAWLKCGTPSDNAVSLNKPEALTSQGEKFGAMTAAAAQKNTPADPTDANEALVAAVRRAKDRMSVIDVKPSKNGTHGTRKGEGHE